MVFCENRLTWLLVREKEGTEQHSVKQRNLCFTLNSVFKYLDCEATFDGSLKIFLKVYNNAKKLLGSEHGC